MAKIRTVEELDDAISKEIAWRKRELTAITSLIEQASGPAQQLHLRAGVLLLYAHWEGWVKNVAKLYIRYVNNQGKPYVALSDAFLGLALKVKISSIKETMAARIHNEFATFIRRDLESRATLSEDLVQTKSNLTSVRFLEVVVRLGLNERETYESRANLIDKQLVDYRNKIAHGQSVQVNVNEFRELRNSVLEILDWFTDDVRNAASTKAYLMSR